MILITLKPLTILHFLLEHKLNDFHEIFQKSPSQQEIFITPTLNPHLADVSFN